ncbi:zinc finger protein 501-like [Gadus morhua]|uniref:zinc finger protein 501-like n=1 Tax=Gadus morhua TaxID=8049 RepID=UPI0011B419DF|nr:zinc finger protein 501-like [Gadus morhua]
MSPCGPTLEEQLSSIMDLLAKGAVSEISQLFLEGSATIRLQLTRSMKENQALRRRMKVMRSKIFSLRLQTRSNASCAARHFALARAIVCKPQTTKPLGNEDCDEFGDCSTQHGATLDSLHVEAPGSSHMSSNSEELRILSVHGKGEYPLAVDGHDNLFTVFKLETLSSLSAEHSVAKRLEGGEQLVHREELTGHRGGGKDRPAVLSGECFPDKTNMVIHRRTHTGEKPYGCDQCTERFKLKDSLKSHMRRTHSGEKPYRCDQCVKCYYRSSHLKRHMKTHSGEKPYRCDQCVKRFSRSCILKEHLRTHSGEKPYRCNQCVKRFISSSHLNVHMRTHSGEKPYRCNQCVKRFSQSSALKRHMRTHYG